MSQFSNQLQASIEECNFTQCHLVDNADVSPGQICRYVAGENRPEPKVFKKISALFPEKHRTPLILAYLLDDVPPRFRNLVTIEPSRTGSHDAEQEPVYRSRMPKQLREAYDYLGRAALEKPSIAQILINTSKLSRGDR